MLLAHLAWDTGLERDKLTIVGALDDVEVGDISNLGKQLDDLLLLRVEGEVADKDGAAIHIVLAEEVLIRIDPGDQVLLFHIERIDAKLVMFADSLWEKSKLLETKSDGMSHHLNTYGVEVALGIKRGKLDEDGLGKLHGFLEVGVQQLAAAELPVGLEDRPGNARSDLTAVAAVDDEGA